MFRYMLLSDNFTDISKDLHIFDNDFSTQNLAWINKGKVPFIFIVSCAKITDVKQPHKTMDVKRINSRLFMIFQIKLIYRLL